VITTSPFIFTGRLDLPHPNVQGHCLHSVGDVHGRLEQIRASVEDLTVGFAQPSWRVQHKVSDQ